MKRIINGVTYNTDTSTVIAKFEQKADDHNPKSTIIWLYQTRGGAFFLHCHDEWHVREYEGWEKKTADSFEPLTYEKAHKWILEGEVEIYNDVFPEPPEAEAEEKPSATLYVRIPQSLKGRIDEAAGKSKLSVNAWAMRCVENCLDPETSTIDALARAFDIANTMESYTDGFTPEQQIAAFRAIMKEIASVWEDLEFPREKGNDAAEDIGLYAASNMRHQFKPYQDETKSEV